MSQLSWDDYFMGIAFLVAERATCLRRKVGAVFVLNRHILSTGYNGAPASAPHCVETGCLREELKIPSGQRHEICRGVHAEQNAIIQAALYGSSIQGAVVYCTNMPCFICAKMLVNCHISAVYYANPYGDSQAKELLAGAGIGLQMLGRVGAK